MATPRYVAKRVGNEYKFVRADSEGVVLSSLGLVAGSLVALKGLRRGGIFGQLMLLGGGGLAYWGATGENPLDKVRGYLESKGAFRQDSGPSFQHDAQSHADQRPQDEVDEASMESFPASDAPAHSRSTGSEVSA